MTDTSLTSGIDTHDLSATIRPQDDLYHHVNQSWIDRTAIPEDRSRFGAFEILRDDAEIAARDIAHEARSAPEGSDARRVGDLYASFLDEERIEQLGAQPLRAPIARVDAVSSGAQLVRLVGELQREGLGGLHQVFVDNDPGDPERYLVFFEQGGLSLPDESYYREEHFDSVRSAFLGHVQRMFELAGQSDAAQRAKHVFDLETRIAARHWDSVASRDSEKTYNLMTWESATSLFVGTSTLNADAGGHATLDEWLAGLGAPANAFGEVVLRQPSFTSSLAELFDDDHLESWKDWLRFAVISGNAPYLSSAFVEEHFDFYGRTLTGAQTLRERWKRGVALVEAGLGEAVGRIYVERHFPPEVKSRMDQLVANLIEAYRQSISSLDWMGEGTRRRALAKLDMFTTKVGYPSTWRDYSSIVIRADDLLANVHALNEFEFTRNLNKIGQPIDRTEWFLTPQTVNAYYNPGFNEIVFPAAILRPPFFDAGRDDAANYGAIGAVIGHEIGHGFDDQGSKFDGAGRLTDWWESSDREAFEAKANALIEQYDALSPRETPSLHVNGALTIGENIGDLGGLAIAWKAYLISLDGAEPAVIDGLSGAERFFLSWAQAWRFKARREEVERLLTIDPHAPDEFRCNQIARNLDVFYETFHAGPKDAMWLDPAARVSIW